MASRHNTANPNVQEVSAEELREHPAPEEGTNEKGESFGEEPDYVYNNRNNQAINPEATDLQEQSEAGSNGQTADMVHTKHQLAKQKKLMVHLPQNPMGQHQMPDEEVTINGHTTQIKRGYTVEVPESVYKVLVQAGKIPPQRPQDRNDVPEAGPKPLVEAK